MVDIHERREQVEAQLAELRRLQAEAFIDGGKPNAKQGDISRLQNELAMLSQAEGVQSERARAEAERQRQQRLANIRVKIAVNEKRRLEAVERAEAATRALLAALEDARVAAKGIEKMAPHVVPKVLHSGLSYIEFERRMSRRIVAVLQQFSPKSKRIGHLTMLYTGYDKPDANWRAIEEKQTDNEFRAIFGGQPCPHHRPVPPAPEPDAPEDDSMKMIEYQPSQKVKFNGQ